MVEAQFQPNLGPGLRRAAAAAAATVLDSPLNPSISIGKPQALTNTTLSFLDVLTAQPNKDHDQTTSGCLSCKDADEPALDQHQRRIQERNSKVLDIDLRDPQGPTEFVRRYVWNSDVTNLQHLFNLLLPVSASDGTGADTGLENGFTASSPSVQFSVETGIGTPFLPLIRPKDDSPGHFDGFVRKLCFEGNNADCRGIKLPQLVMPIGYLVAKSSFEGNPWTRPHGRAAYAPRYTVLAAILPTTAATSPAVYGTTTPESNIKSPFPSPPSSSQGSSQEQALSHPSTGNGGVWLMYNDIYDEDEDSDMEDDELEEVHAECRDQAFQQTFGHLVDSQHKPLPLFDLACVLDDWKDLFRPDRSHPPRDPVQTLRATAMTIWPYLQAVKSDKVATMCGNAKPPEA